MKRYTLLSAILIILGAMLMPLTTHAQTGSDLIVLNDATPGIDVVVNPSPNTTGVIALEIDNASVIVTDAVGNVVFSAADSGIAGVEFSFAPNAGTHTVTIERLPGAGQAYARIASLSDMTSLTDIPQLVSASTLTLNQEADYPLTANSPSSVVDFAVSDADYATVTARFPGAPVTAQLVSTQDNRMLAMLNGSLIDGVRFKVDSGTYELMLLNNNTASATVANVSVLSAPQSDFETMVADASASNTATTVSTTSSAGTTGSVASAAPACTVTISASSVNLRSGPGTGYSVLEYAFRGEALAVGGINTQSNWLLVGTDNGSGWVAGDLGTLSGSCATLTAYDIPYREATTPQVTIQQPQVSVYQDDSSSSYDDDHDDDHDEHEDEHDEHDDD